MRRWRTGDEPDDRRRSSVREPVRCDGGQPSQTGYLAPHVPSQIKPQEMNQPGGGTLRQNPFAVVVADTKSGAGAAKAMSTWLSWAGDGTPHPGPDSTGAYYLWSNFPLTADGTTPIGHPSLGVCSMGGGGAPLAMIAGEIHGTMLNNHSDGTITAPVHSAGTGLARRSCSTAWESRSPTPNTIRRSPESEVQALGRPAPSWRNRVNHGRQVSIRCPTSKVLQAVINVAEHNAASAPFSPDSCR
jgi:hypothetical protein